MIEKIISLYKIWILKKELFAIDREIEDFYIILLSRSDRFLSIDVETHYQKFVKLRNIEKKELIKQIKELKK
jgi:hypothetical protein